MPFLTTFAALPMLVGFFLSPFQTAFLGLTLNSGGAPAEGYRAGFEAVPLGQREATDALGKSRLQKMLRRHLSIRALDLPRCACSWPKTKRLPRLSADVRPYTWRQFHPHRFHQRPRTRVRGLFVWSEWKKADSFCPTHGSLFSTLS